MNYLVYLENRGSATGLDPRISITLDPRLSYLPGSSKMYTKEGNNDVTTQLLDSKMKFEGNKITWGFVNMAPRTADSLYIEFAAIVGPDASFPVGDTNIQNVATSSFLGNNLSVNTNVATLTVRRAPANTVSFSLRKESSVNKIDWYDDRLGGAVAGEKVYYRLVLQNTGNTVAQNVLLKDILPAGVSYVGNATLNGNAVDAGSLVNGGYTFASVNPGTSGTQVLIFEAKVQTACSATSMLSNKGQVIYMNAVKAEDTADLILSCTKGLIIQKDVKVDGGTYVDNVGTVPAGTTLTYRITVFNNGDVTSTGTYLRDALPANVTYVPGTFAIDDELMKPEFEKAFFSQGLLMTNLTKGLAKDVTFKVKVNACPIDLKSVVNTAYVKSDTSPEISDTAKATITCDTKSTPTPTPGTTPKPIKPGTPLPHTGGNEVALGFAALSGAGVSLRHALAKSRLKKAASNVDVL